MLQPFPYELSSLRVHLSEGLKRLDTGALVKDYEGKDKEVEQAVQLGLQDVVSEDPRFLEKDAPPLNVEFPEGSRIIFLGEHGYGVAAQVSATNETSLSVTLAVRLRLFVIIQTSFEQGTL